MLRPTRRCQKILLRLPGRRLQRLRFKRAGTNRQLPPVGVVRIQILRTEAEGAVPLICSAIVRARLSHREARPSPCGGLGGSRSRSSIPVQGHGTRTDGFPRWARCRRRRCRHRNLTLATRSRGRRSRRRHRGRSRRSLAGGTTYVALAANRIRPGCSDRRISLVLGPGGILGRITVVSRTSVTRHGEAVQARLPHDAVVEVVKVNRCQKVGAVGRSLDDIVLGRVSGIRGS